MVSILYADVDGTLTGPRGDFLAGADGNPSLAAAEALVSAREAGLDVVLCSGRSRARLGEIARFLGLPSHLAELGGVRTHDRGRSFTYEHGACPYSGPPADHLRPVMVALAAAFAGQVEPADPFNEDREVSVLLRGRMDVDAARAWLTDEGYGWVDIHDNATVQRTSPTLPGVTPLHIYHLAPRGVSKPASIAHDLAARGLEREECAFVGDSPADLEVASVVGQLFIVANGADHRPEMRDALAAYDNATLTTAHYGDGFAESVRTLLFLRA